MSEKKIQTGIRLSLEDNERLSQAQKKLGGLSKQAVILIALHALYKSEGIQ